MSDHSGLAQATGRSDASPPLRDCERRFANIEDLMNKHDTTIYGKDGDNGLVSDIKLIKYQTGTFRTVVQSSLSILIAITTYYLVKVFGL